NVKSNHPEKTSHPCQFPIELIERCILALTNEDDWILDPFCGVGSALIAAVKHKRRAMGIDRDAEYCKIAIQRLNSYHEGTLKIRPINKEIYKPTGRERVSQIPVEWLIKEHP
ncbi:MAG: site-specific DNA-methyltransferase, partial [Nitrospirae bacterium]|nr:site-specific DNA-methyltransferase [Nitrospirota bacterium]